MKKKSSLSGFLLIVVIAASAYALYRFYGVPYLQKRAMDKALDQGAEAVTAKFEEQKEEIKEDLKAILARMDQEEGAQEQAETAPVIVEEVK